MIQIWGVLYKKQRRTAQVTVTAPSGSMRDVGSAVDDICRELDIARPIWLSKHEKDMEAFGRAAFTRDDFAEEIRFDRFEVEILREKSVSKDPRNDFS